METQEKASGQAYEHAFQWLGVCGNAVRKMTAALIQNDLVKLEECLEEQTALISQYSQVKAMLLLPGKKPGVSLPLVCGSLTSLAAQVTAVNRRNAALVAAGLDFSR